VPRTAKGGALIEIQWIPATKRQGMKKGGKVKKGIPKKKKGRNGSRKLPAAKSHKLQPVSGGDRSWKKAKKEKESQEKDGRQEGSPRTPS